MDIALLPEYCNRGIGTTLLRGLQTEAAAAGRLLRIHVERFNPALRLYARLGFRQIDDRGSGKEKRGQGKREKGETGRVVVPSPFCLFP